jgi:hypothetical protein
MIEDVWFLMVRDPLSPVRSLTDLPAGMAVIVHARTLLHPALPQPDAGRVYRCLTEFPGRVPGCLVAVSDLDYELCGGRLWADIADRHQVLSALARLTAGPHRCDCLFLSVWPRDAELLNGGPFSHWQVLTSTGGEAYVAAAEGTAERRALLASLEQTVRCLAAGRDWWPGGNLLPPPQDPAVMPYQPYGT